MKNCIIILLIWLTISGCTKEITDYVQKNAQTYLSVEGGISDQPEQQSLKLYFTSLRIDYSSLSEPILGAIVYVLDEKGNKFDYQEVGNGLYKTTEKLGGHAGGIYTLYMKIAGKMYQSSPETMPLSPAIDKIYYETNIKENYPLDNPERAGFDIYVDFKDSEETGNHYRWIWKNYSKIQVCSLIVDEFRAYCIGDCYDILSEPDFNLLSDELLNGKQVQRNFITRVPYIWDQNVDNFDKYYLRVEQRAITPNAYQMFRSLKNAQNSGNLFDVPALTQFSLNIKCLSDSTQKILGIFDVYSSKYKIIYVNLNIPNLTPFVKHKPGNADCSGSPCKSECEESDYRTKQKPEGY